MTSYRLLDGASGRPGVGSSGTQPPSSVVGYSGNFQSGTWFRVTKGGCFLEGFWWWVPPGGDTGTQKFCLYSATTSGGVSLISAATSMSGTLTAGAMNFIPLSTPLPIAIGTDYLACTGWSAVNGFPETVNQLGSGNPYASGVTNGPLVLPSDSTSGGSAPFTQYTHANTVFSVNGPDPATVAPGQGDRSAIFWVDVQITDVTPGSYTGALSLYPNKADADGATTGDSALNYVVGTQVDLSAAGTLGAIKYYSPSGSTQLATEATIWDLGTNLPVVNNASPSWSAAAGSGWVRTAMTPTVLPAGQYAVTVYNGAATPSSWSAHTASGTYWSTGFGANGISWGILSAPKLSDARNEYIYNGNAGGTPPFSSGLQEPGQCLFAIGPPNKAPYLYVDGLAQNYWVDLEVTPVAAPPAGGLLMACFP